MTDIQRILEAGVAAGHAPGFVAAAITPSGERVTASAGVRGVDNAAPMTPDTLFWIASCTKAVTTVAALQCVERGLVDLDEPVGRLLPALAAPKVLDGFDAAGKPILRPAGQPITLRRLLTHTSGFGYDFCSADLARYLEATGGVLLQVDAPDIPLMFEPGQRWLYGIGLDWAGKLIETVSGQGLDVYFADHILRPLGMADTTFFPGEAHARRRASVHQRQTDGRFQAIAFTLPPTPHFMMGGGGLYSTAGDYLTFLAAILAGGAPILEPASVAAMSANQTGELSVGVLATARPELSGDYDPLPGASKQWGLGFLINPAGPAGRAAGSLAWAGLANCYYWADPASGAAGVLLSQVLPFADPGVLATFAAFERAVYG